MQGRVSEAGAAHDNQPLRLNAARELLVNMLQARGGCACFARLSAPMRSARMESVAQVWDGTTTKGRHSTVCEGTSQLKLLIDTGVLCWW